MTDSGIAMMKCRISRNIYTLAFLLLLSVILFKMFFEHDDSEIQIDNANNLEKMKDIKPFDVAQNAFGKEIQLQNDNKKSDINSLNAADGMYQPNWESLDKRPLPKWYDEAKIGIFIHWGVFSVPSFGSEWFWWFWKGSGPYDRKATIKFMKDNYRPNFTYADFAADFTAEFFDPDDWADIFAKSGAKYVVLTSKHHEGYTLWPSEYSYSWNSVEVGPKRDLVGDLGTAIRKKNLKFGLYHSLYEWFHPLYQRDKRNNFKTQYFVRMKTMPELYELTNIYKPDVIWSDGEWEAEDTYWNSTEYIAWLYNHSPVKDSVVVNDRWGKSVRCKHGGFLGCSDRYNPGQLQKRKWENCMTIDKKSWGYRREASLKDYFTIEELLAVVVKTISYGGNILMNIGPAHDGTISSIYLERLTQIGQWLNVTGEAIYSSVPWKYQEDKATKNVWYTKRIIKGDAFVYAIVLMWPKGNKLFLQAPVTTENTEVYLLGHKSSIKWTKLLSGGINIEIPYIPYNEMPCKWSWVFKMTNIENS